MMGIHDFFSGLEIEGSDSISEKNLKIKGVGTFALLKDILGFDFNSNKKTIQLEEINGTNCLLSWNHGAVLAGILQKESVLKQISK